MTPFKEHDLRLLLVASICTVLALGCLTLVIA